MKIKKNDNVIMLNGKDKGKKGKVLKAIPVDNKVVVEGLNVVKRHQKAKRQGTKGEIIDVARAVDVSNVALVESGKAVRVGWKIEGDKKVRISKKTGQKI